MQVTEALTAFQEALQSRYHSWVETGGLRAGLAFVDGVLSRIRQQMASLERTIKANATQAQQALDAVHNGTHSLRGWLKGMGTDKRAQDRIVAQLQASISASLNGMTREAALKVLQRLVDKLLPLSTATEKALSDARKRLEAVERMIESCQAGASVTTTSQVEIDITSPEMDRAVFQEFAISDQTLRDQLAKDWKIAAHSVPKQCAVNDQAFALMQRRIERYFRPKIGTICVIDVIDNLLSKSSTRDRLKMQLEELGIACQPAWRASPSSLSIQYADSIVIGFPKSKDPNKQARVVDCFKEVSSSINSRGLYLASVGFAVTRDPARIYVSRRTHGGRPEYLPSLHDCERAYQQWMANGGESMHLYDDDLVAKMPQLIASPELDEGELAFALGLAYGWISKRGPYWYWNLKCLDESKQDKFEVPSISDWDCLAFRNQKSVLSSNPLLLSTKLQDGFMKYLGGTKLNEDDRLGESMAEAAEEIGRNQEMIEYTLSCFDRHRALSGDLAVASELQLYLDSVASRIDSEHADYHAFTEQMNTLRCEIEKLNP